MANTHPGVFDRFSFGRSLGQLSILECCTASREWCVCQHVHDTEVGAPFPAAALLAVERCTNLYKSGNVYRLIVFDIYGCSLLCQVLLPSVVVELSLNWKTALAVLLAALCSHQVRRMQFS